MFILYEPITKEEFKKELKENFEYSDKEIEIAVDRVEERIAKNKIIDKEKIKEEYFNEIVNISRKERESCPFFKYD